MYFNRWYKQTFRPSPDVLYLRPDTELKNGRLQGPMVTVDPERPRSKPRGKRVSVHPRLDANLWTEVPESAVPESVKEAAAAYAKHGDVRRAKRRSRRSRRSRRARR